MSAFVPTSNPAPGISSSWAHLSINRSLLQIPSSFLTTPVKTRRLLIHPAAPCLPQKFVARFYNPISMAQSTASPNPNTTIDWPKIGKYILALFLQFVTITALLAILDKACATAAFANLSPLLKKLFGYFLFVGLAFRSRVFSILDSSRPTMDEIRQVKRPSWFPPKITFPIVWSIIGFILRPGSCVVAWVTLGYTLVSPPILAYVFSLCIGDLWNHITNVQRDLGLSALLVFPVWCAGVNNAYQMYQANVTAGYLITPLPVWLTAAAALTVSTWFLNGKPSLLPRTTQQN